MAKTGSPLVMVVDDDADTRSLYQLVLDLAGFDVVSAESGADALEKVRHRQPDILVTDVLLPGMDGLALLAVLRREEQTREIPVIAVTGYAKGDLLKGAGDAVAFDAVLLKPFAPEALVAVVSSLCAAGRTPAPAPAPAPTPTPAPTQLPAIDPPSDEEPDV